MYSSANRGTNASTAEKRSTEEANDIASRQQGVGALLWYKTMKRKGLEYGPHFQGLRNVTANVVQREAIATIARPKIPEHTSSYAMHPTSMDFVLHVCSVSS